MRGKSEESEFGLQRTLGKFLFVYPFYQSMSIANAKAQNTIRCADREIASSVAKSKRKMPMVKKLEFDKRSKKKKNCQGCRHIRCDSYYHPRSSWSCSLSLAYPKKRGSEFLSSYGGKAQKERKAGLNSDQKVVTVQSPPRLPFLFTELIQKGAIRVTTEGSGIAFFFFCEWWNHYT